MLTRAPNDQVDIRPRSWGGGSPAKKIAGTAKHPSSKLTRLGPLSLTEPRDVRYYFLLSSTIS